jgi:uncharacterized membrane protein (DUF485 family)
MSVSAQPVLSQIEFSEKLKNLPAARRLLYALLTALTLIGVFLLVVVLAVLVMSVVSGWMGAPVTSFEHYVLLALPILGAMMVGVGVSGSAMPETVLPGATLARIARRAFRSGLITGFLTVFFFSVIWGFVIRLPVIFQPVMTVDMGTLALEVMVFSGVMALVIAPAYALFRAFSSICGMIALHWFDSRK